MNTRERILNIAIELFNAQGTAAVSTNHIAEAASISPGNLYYHFSNKEEIIRAAFDRLYAEWDEIYVLPEDSTPTLDDLLGLVRANFTMMSGYRFVYRELIALLRRDPELMASYVAIRQRGYDGFQILFAQFASAGVLPASADPAEISRIADLCWLISEFWLTSLEISGQPIDPDRLQHGIDLMMQVLRPRSSDPNRLTEE